MFQLLFERSGDAIWMFDPAKQVFVDCNSAAVTLMGAGTKDKLLMAHPAELSPAFQPDGRSSREAAAEVSALVDQQGSHRFEWIARRFDGTEVPLEVISTAIVAQGRALHVVVSRDITERKKAESALRESQQLVASIADNIVEAIYRTDPRHELVYVNAAHLRLFGYHSLEELRAIPRERLYANPEDRTPLIQQLANEGRFTRELEFVRKDGTHFWGLIQSVAIHDPHTGAVSYHVGSITDVTESKRIQNELRQLNATLERRVAERTAEVSASEARLRTLIEHAPEAIVVFDGNSGRFLECNDNAVRLFGLSREQLCQMHPAEVSPLVQPDGRLSLVAAQQFIQRALAGEAPVFDWMHKHSSGKFLPCEVRLVRLPAEGQILVRGSVTDTSERKRREKIQQATYRISEAVHAAENLASLYVRIHEIIKDLMPAENFYIALFDQATELISFPHFVDERSPRPQAFKLGTGLTGYVLRTGKALLVDGAMNQRKRRCGDQVTFDGIDGLCYVESGEPAATWLGVPLSIQGDPFGVMAVQDYHNGEAYGEEEKRILEFVARQTALAIDRKRAEESLMRRADQVRRHRNALLELALLDKSDFDRAVESICARAASTSSIARVGYWSLQRDATELVCEALHLLDQDMADPNAKGVRITAAAYPGYFKALSTREPIAAHNAETHPSTVELADGYLRPLGITSMLDVPVWLNGKLVGVLCHEHVGEPREWTPEEIDFAASVANMVSLSLEAAQRAKSEQALRESEQKFRALFEASSQGVMIHDEEKFLEVNPATLRILGFDNAAAVLGKHPKDTSPAIQPNGESSAVAAARHIAECMEKGSARFDWTSLNAHGQEVPVEVILTRVELKGRHIIQAVINDISERKKAEAELRASAARLRESEARFSAAFHANPVCTTLARMSDGHFVEANESFLQWFGATSPEVLDKTSVELGLWADTEERAGFWKELNEQGRVRHRECNLRNRRGSIHSMLLSADIVEINGQPHILTVGLDLSERKKVEAELLRALGHEKELSQLKTNFVSMVSHEFRTPLGIIMSSAEILEDYLEQLDSDERKHHLRSIARNTKRMSELMEEVLVLGRLDAGRMDFKPAPIDLRILCTKLVEEVRSATELACPIEVKICELPANVFGDERLLRHILLNLLTNSVKYSEAGRLVQFTIERDGRDAVCLIRDQGIGIPEGDRTWLFNAFHRGRNVGHRPGTGLGLVIVKRCVELHGGRIEVESKLGEGTTMTVRLPLFQLP